MSVQIEPTDVHVAVARRPSGYVVTATADGGVHMRAVVVKYDGSGFVARVGSQTARNAGRTGTVTLMWPPYGDHTERYDDHTVIADCDARCVEAGDSFELVARPTSAVWHRPAR